MPPTPQKPPESHYDLNKLHKIFAFAALTLLIALLALFAKDYSKEWKVYQQQFRELDAEKAKVKLDLEENDLAKNEEYQNLLKEKNAAQEQLKAKSAEIATINQHISSVTATVKILTQQSQFAKAEYDTVKYAFEEARAHESRKADGYKKRLDELSVKIEKLRVQIEEKNEILIAETNKIKEIEKSAKDLEKQTDKIAKKSDILSKKIDRIDPEHMSVPNLVAGWVRNLPVIELANSDYRIKQIVLKDITDDVNFMRVPKVDRCITCHLGIDNPDFKDAPQPLRTHPNLELFMDKNSPHPLDQFACTTCHMGRGRATDFIGAVHTPRDAKQREEWEKKYGWREFHHWEAPMLPAGLTQASCFKCHSGQTVIKGAEKLNLGLNLIEKSGCYGCHTIEKYQSWPKSGPSLESLASKTTKEWTYRWIDDPQSIRPNTSMPAFFHLSNNSDPESVARGQQEVHAMVAFLFANSKAFAPEAPAITGNPVKGEELVASVGCFACHQITKEKAAVRDRNEIRREQGPSLIGLGSKTSKEWLYAWLKDPYRYHPGTRMPNMRLSDQEAMDIATYLSQDKTDNLKPLPPVDGKVLTQIVREFILKTGTVADTEKQISVMTQDDKLQFAGKRLIRQYGCYSCHNIPGYENEKPIGADLTEEGSKDIHRLDFGLVHIDHTKQAWFKQKLMDPRIFDHGKIKTADDKLRMPNFYFSDAEADAITVALMGFVKDRPAASKMSPRTPERLFIEEGEKIIRQYNCQGCHIIDGEGATIKDTVVDWLVKFQDKDLNDAKALSVSFSPPNLIGQGQKVQTAWLFEFLHHPTTIRPWLSVRMPTYNFHTSELNGLVKYFSYLDNQQFPFDDIFNVHGMDPESVAAGEKLFSKDYFGCAACHIVGGTMPGGSPDSWAPDFAIAKTRLKPEWIVKWLTDPQALLPGSKMPTYFDPKSFDNAGPEDVLKGDERAQIRALRDYLMTISNESAANGAHPAVTAPAPAAPAPAIAPEVKDGNSNGASQQTSKE
ncbi:MAG: c-type cytochrome [Candidatus Omnitrophica bacterium]|nr:c-type cytochrome [Candidatus Omnitrophota bacterium]